MRSSRLQPEHRQQLSDLREHADKTDLEIISRDCTAFNSAKAKVSRILHQ